MRDLVRQIVEGYRALKLEGQEEGFVVFSGQEPDTRQPVSIKILPRVLGKDPQIARRFEALSRTIRQLNHPNIVPVRKVGEQAGLPYIVTGVVEKGQRLAASLDQPWAIDAAADLVMQVGQALEHAYNKGMVHGSLTPESVVVQDRGKVLVSDFGLGEMMDMVGARSQQAVSPFLAPERAAGKAADARADVYSLAAIFYQLLAGRSPMVVKGEVLPPGRFHPDLPAGIDAVLVKALAPDPRERYPDVKAFLAALGGVVLASRVKPAAEASASQICPRCGAANQSGRFCRKCGTRLPGPQAEKRAVPPPPRTGSKLDEPIQITRIEVGHVEVGSGIELRETVIAQPMAVATGELAAQFPEPLPMPELGISAAGLWPAMGDQPAIAMPEPPPMPAIDWAEIAPPMPEVPVIGEVIAGEERL